MCSESVLNASRSIGLHWIQCKISVKVWQFSCKGSFESGAFSNLKRAAAIDMRPTGKNANGTEKVTYLDQHVFEEFFSKDHRNEVKLLTIDCKDYRSYWLIKNDKYKSNRQIE